MVGTLAGYFVTEVLDENLAATESAVADVRSSTGENGLVPRYRREAKVTWTTFDVRKDRLHKNASFL